MNNFFGRQFNSPNDVVVHPRNGEIYFTDSLYGYVQNFRPPPGLPTLVYRWNPKTGSLSVVADGFDKPNGRSSFFHSGIELTRRRRDYILAQRRFCIRDRYRLPISRVRV